MQDANSSKDLSQISQDGASHQPAVEEDGESPDAVHKSDSDERQVCMVCQYFTFESFLLIKFHMYPLTCAL